MNFRNLFRFLVAVPAKRGVTLGELRKAAEMDTAPYRKWGDECQPEAYMPLPDNRLSARFVDGRESVQRFKAMVDQYYAVHGEVDSLMSQLPKLFPPQKNVESEV